MSETKMLSALLNKTDIFFKEIFNSDELQQEYDLADYINRDYVFSVIKEFRDNPGACMIKPFYENDYEDSSVPRSVIVKRNDEGYITAAVSDKQAVPYFIEPFRFVSIIKQSLEDEEIKKEMHEEKENGTENDMEK